MVKTTASSPSVAKRAQRLYRAAPPVSRVLQSLRPYISPFDDLLDQIPAGAHVLDVGCGAGLMLGLVAETCPNASGIGFDLNGHAIVAAQKMAANNGFADRIRFEHRLAGEAWPAGQFDVVCLVDVLHHVPPAQQQTIVEQSYTHVCPGGVLIYKDMAQRPLFSALWNRAHDLLLARQWVHYRAIAEVAGWLDTQGAQVVKKYGRSMGPYAHELIVARKPDAAAAA